MHLCKKEKRVHPKERICTQYFILVLDQLTIIFHYITSTVYSSKRVAEGGAMRPRGAKRTRTCSCKTKYDEKKTFILPTSAINNITNGHEKWPILLFLILSLSLLWFFAFFI